MRLLVVEDDRRLAQLLTRGLLAEGFAVDVARDGYEGLWRASEGAYDVIVLDILLPGLNGYHVCGELRKKQIWTPILMLTAKDGEYDEAEGLDVGADDYLTKPFSYVVLIARLRALIRRGQPVRPTVLRTGDLELDPVSRRCRRGQTPIRLTAKEYAVLRFLMQRAEEVVTKSEVIEHVWDFASDVDPNLVEVYISTLRRKIDTPFACRTITTVRGVGYRLTADDNGAGRVEFD